MGKDNNETAIVICLLCFCSPPFAVWYKKKKCDGDVFLNIALTCCGVLPGLAHAIYICFFKNDIPQSPVIVQQPQPVQVVQQPQQVQPVQPVQTAHTIDQPSLSQG